jgi:hypothetical protein
MTETNKVACFYTEFKNNKETTDFTQQCFPLINYWEKSWQANGWQTFVLGESYIDKNRYYFDLKFDKFDESNLCKYSIDWDCEYSRACYLRWLAYYQFCQEHGDIFWADYDIINYSFTPNNRVIATSSLIGCNSAGKMNEYGGKKILDTFRDVECGKYNFEKLSAKINKWDNSKKISDMMVTQEIAKIPLHEPILGRVGNLRYNSPTDSNKDLVHYDNGVYLKPSSDDLLDVRQLVYKPNGQKYSRIETVFILEKHFGFKHYE